MTGNHFLVINHESYDSSIVFGVFASFAEARSHVESSVWPDHHPVIEEWDGSLFVRRAENLFGSYEWEMDV